MTTVKLVDVAKTIRSKNAGVNQITFDIIFADADIYRLVKRSGAITQQTIAGLFGIPSERISTFVEFDPASAIKFTITRTCPNGSPGDWDILGCQYYAPLTEFTLEVDLDRSGGEQPIPETSGPS